MAGDRNDIKVTTLNYANYQGRQQVFEFMEEMSQKRLLLGTESPPVLQPAALQSLGPFLSLLRSGSTSPLPLWPLSPYLWILHGAFLVARGDE